MIKNYLYNLMYQLITILLPVLTIPYTSRILGADGIGRYSLTYAYMQNFALFGMIGLSMYASREVACVKDDEEKLSRVFWELNLLKCITMGIAIILYIVFIMMQNGEYRYLYIIQGIILLSNVVDISWLFIGLENFKKVSIRNSIVKLSGVLLVFLFVKKSSDVWLYALALNVTHLIGQIIMWLDLPKIISLKRPDKKEVIRHFKLSLKLFIPQIAINVYTILDKVMLGTLTTEYQVGIYENAQKIIKISMTIVTSLAGVTIPRMANLYKNNLKVEFSETAYKSFSFVSFMAFPMTFGLVGICNSFIPWFFGDGFYGINKIFYFGSWLMVSLAWSSILGSQVLISMKRDKEFTIAVTCGAIINLITNYLLIKRYMAVGATISSVIAEFVGMFIMLYFTKDILNIKRLFRCVPKYLISSLIMYFALQYFNNFIELNFIGTIFLVFLGLITYILLMILIKDENIQYIFNAFHKKILNEQNVN